MLKKITLYTMLIFSFASQAGAVVSTVETDYNFSPRGSYVDIPDMNGNGSPDIAVLGYDTSTNQPLIVVKDSLTGNFIKYVTYFDPSWNVVWSLQKVDDQNGNTYPELALKATNPTSGDTKIQILDSYSGAEVNSLVFAGVSTATNTHSIQLQRSSNQYLSVPDSPSMSPTGDFTFEFWFTPASLPASGAQDSFAGKWNSSDNNRSFQLIFQNIGGVPNVGMSTSADGVTSSDGTINTSILSVGVPTHLAFIFNAAAGSCEVIGNDGSLGTITGLAHSIFNGNANIVIGTRTDNGSLPADGLFDDVRLWSGKRTLSEISANKNVELTGTEPNLLGYWKLNNGYTDSTGNGNNATPVNSPVFSTTVPF